MNINILKDNKSILKIAMSATLLLNLFYLIYYICDIYRSQIHSDSAAKVLLAKEIFDSGNYFPPDWNYVNNDIFVLFGHTFIVPLLAFIPPGFGAHAISGVISAGIILALVWTVAHLLRQSRVVVIACVAIFASGVSPFMSENLYGQVSYGVILYHTLAVLVSSLLWIDKRGNKAAFFLVAASVVVGLAFWQNPQRALVAQGYPIVAAAISLAFFHKVRNRSELDKGRIGILLAAVLGGAAIGTFAHLVTLQNVNSVVGASNARWLPFEEAVRNIGLTLQGVVATLGGLPSAGTKVTSPAGAIAAFRLVAAFSFVVVAVMALRSLLTRGDHRQHFFAAFVLHSALPVLLLQIFTTVPDMSDPIQSARYLVPVVALSIIAACSYAEQLARVSYTSVLAVVALVPLAATGPLSAAAPAFVSPQVYGQNDQYADNRLEITAFMEANDLKYGYASYWNANVFSVLSGGKTLVRPIFIHDLQPFRHLSSDRWYSEEAWSGPTFILLSDDETKILNRDLLAAFGYHVDRTLSVAGYKILTFAENIAGRLPGWDTSLPYPKPVRLTEKSDHMVGKYLEIASKGILQSEIGETGALHYGPYWLLRRGDYRVEYSFEFPGTTKGGVRVDVATTSTETNILASSEVSSSGIVSLNFRNEVRQPVEFRVWVDGTSTVRLNGISVRARDDDMGAP